jgi:thiol-disulfide isomerase/thioredoxin
MPTQLSTSTVVSGLLNKVTSGQSGPLIAVDPLIVEIRPYLTMSNPMVVFKLRKYLIPVLFFLVFITSGAAQDQSKGYALKFKVEGWKDTTAYLGHYFGEGTYIKDTARVNGKGEFVFTGTKPLGPGMYFIVLKNSQIFELLVGENQHFTLETKSENYLKYMKATDLDNKLFYENILFNIDRHKEADPFVKMAKDSTLSEEQRKSARDAFAKINEKVIQYQNDLIQKHPQTLTATILKANQAVKIPDPPKKADGSIDSTFQLRWYRKHFFDNFDLSNEALLRVPRSLYSEKIKEYLDKLYAPNPDTITEAINRIISVAKKNKETFRYALWACMVKYQQPEIMGLDEVYVNLYDRYFETGECDYWVNATMKKNLKDYADRLRKSLIGNTAPDLIMQDANLKPRSMYDIKNRYTILFIYDPDCGHCRKETPKLVEFYNKNKKRFDFEVYAVNIDTSMAKMKDFVKEMKAEWITVNGPRTYVGPYSELYDALTTPSLFILDENKKIIAKKLPVERLEEFFINYKKFHKG